MNNKEYSTKISHFLLFFSPISFSFCVQFFAHTNSNQTYAHYLILRAQARAITSKIYSTKFESPATLNAMRSHLVHSPGILCQRTRYVCVCVCVRFVLYILVSLAFDYQNRFFPLFLESVNQTTHFSSAVGSARPLSFCFT